MHSTDGCDASSTIDDSIVNLRRLRGRCLVYFDDRNDRSRTFALTRDAFTASTARMTQANVARLKLELNPNTVQAGVRNRRSRMRRSPHLHAFRVFSIFSRETVVCAILNFRVTVKLSGGDVTLRFPGIVGNLFFYYLRIYCFDILLFLLFRCVCYLFNE